MVSISSLFAILIRISLLFQGQLEGINDRVHLDFFENQTFQSEQGNLHQPHISFDGIGSLVPSIEIEERSEVESEKSSKDLIFGDLPSIKELSFLKTFSLFTNKAIRGSRLPLYDFLHSWKIHLS